MPPLGALRAFEAAARHLSVSRAGDELGVTHAAVSHQIRSLEEWVGTPLVERHGRGIRLTRPGERLSEGLTPLFDRLGVLSRQTREEAGRSSLTVGCIPSIASRWLAPNLARFASDRPEIDLRVVYAMAHETLPRGPLDVLITYGENTDPSVRAATLFSRISKPVCSPHLLARLGPFNTPARIAAAPLLHDETRDAWRAWFAAAGLPGADVRRGPVFQDFNLLATAAIAGHGTALCPVEVFREEIADGDLVVLSDIAVNADKRYLVMTGTDAPPAADLFVSWFLSVTAKPDGASAGASA